MSFKKLACSLGSLRRFMSRERCLTLCIHHGIHSMSINIETNLICVIYRLVTFKVNITDLHNLNNLKNVWCLSSDIPYYVCLNGQAGRWHGETLTNRLCVLLLEYLTQKNFSNTRWFVYK